MIKLALNTYPVNSGHKARGIGFYTRNLIRGLKDVQDVEVIEFDDINKLTNVDLVHFPYFDLYKHTLPISKRFKTVVTIHDVIPLIFKDHYPPGIKGKINFLHQKLSLKNVSHIITDSASSKKDITYYLGVKPDNISVVYLAAPEILFNQVSSTLIREVRSKYQLPQNYAIFVGSVNWNKNILNMTKSCLQANLDICLVGNDFILEHDLNHPELIDYKTFLSQFKDDPKVHRIGYVSDEDLEILIRESSLLLLPSYYEGFGLPVLHAQILETPVLTSRISSLPEVGGDGAYYIDPGDVGEMTKAIIEVKTNNKLRKDLIKKGMDNVKRFSWKHTIENTVKIYKQVLGDANI